MTEDLVIDQGSEVTLPSLFLAMIALFSVQVPLPLLPNVLLRNIFGLMSQSHLCFTLQLGILGDVRMVVNDSKLMGGERDAFVYHKFSDFLNYTRHVDTLPIYLLLNCYHS